MKRFCNHFKHKKNIGRFFGILLAGEILFALPALFMALPAMAHDCFTLKGENFLDAED